MSIKEITDNLGTKEGLLNLLTQIIKDNPNDADLGRILRKLYSNYLKEPQ